MAITNAQQARQLYKKGKRVGFFTAGLAGGDSISPGTSSTGGTTGGGYGRKEGETAAQDMGNYNYDESQGRKNRDLAAANAKEKAFLEQERLKKTEFEKKEKEKRKENTTLFGTVKNYFSKIKNINNLKQRQRFIDSFSFSFFSNSVFLSLSCSRNAFSFAFAAAKSNLLGVPSGFGILGL